MKISPKIFCAGPVEQSTHRFRKSRTISDKARLILALELRVFDAPGRGIKKLTESEGIERGPGFVVTLRAFAI